MAKTAPVKKKGQSVHSRAAKRASSPSIDTDKSLKNIKPPVESSSFRPSILAIHQGAGVTKKSKHGRKSVLSSKAKRRQEKGLDRAEAVMDKTETKIEKSKDRARVVQGRSKAWDELNRKVLARKAREEAIALEKEIDAEKWVDENQEEAGEMEDAAVDAVYDLKVGNAPSIEDAGIATAEMVADSEDEIL